MKTSAFPGPGLQSIMGNCPLSPDDVSEGTLFDIPLDFQFTAEEMDSLMQIVGPNFSGDTFNDNFTISELDPVQIGTGHENSDMSPELHEFYLLESALSHIQTYRVDFNPPEENVGIILTDPVNVLHSYIDRNRAKIEIQIQKWGSQG